MAVRSDALGRDYTLLRFDWSGRWSGRISGWLKRPRYNPRSAPKGAVGVLYPDMTKMTTFEAKY